MNPPPLNLSVELEWTAIRVLARNGQAEIGAHGEGLDRFADEHQCRFTDASALPVRNSLAQDVIFGYPPKPNLSG